MDFCIAYTFTDSIARRTGDEQKAIKTTAFDLKLMPANSGMILREKPKQGRIAVNVINHLGTGVMKVIKV